MEAKRLSMDRISSLPGNIIETILCLVPIRDAVRTSTLSRKWRYNWVKIPELVFIEGDMFDKSSEKFKKLPCEWKSFIRSCKIFKAIYQVLLMHHGPIHKFTLSMISENTCVEIDQIILHLLRLNTLKKLSLDLPDMTHVRLYRLPLSIFSLHQLTDLCLEQCELNIEPTFSGFDKLTSLSLSHVYTSSYTLAHLLSSCPLLKRLTLMLYYDDIFAGSRLTIIDLCNCLLMIENLSISGWIIMCFAESGVPQELPTALVHLKYLFIESFTFDNEYHLRFLGLLMRSSPNMESLKLEIEVDDEFDTGLGSVILEEYSDVCLEHLNELKIIEFTFSERELEFLKLILNKSPVLKKMNILPANGIADSEQLKTLKVLLRSPRASPIVEIVVQ